MKTLCGSVVFFGAVSMGVSASTLTEQLESFEDRARPVVILSESAGDPLVQRQVKMLERNKAALDERDIKVLQEVGARSSARASLNAPTKGFAVVLVGKDGGVKKIWREPVASKTIFALIDSMPMRQDEMNRHPTTHPQ